MITLTKDQILLLHKQLIARFGGTLGIRDEGLLDSAPNAPFQSFDGQDLYGSILEKAVRLGFGLVKDHPFYDGNKRIAALAMLVTLDMNGIDLNATNAELAEEFLQVAAGEGSADDLLNWVLTHVD